MLRLLKKFGIFYELVDAQMRVLPSEARFWDLLSVRQPPCPVPLGDVFPELCGSEDAVEQVLSSKVEEFRLPAIRRGDRYFNLRVMTDPLVTLLNVRGLIALEDVTEELMDKQALVQDKNEISLLTRELRTRHDETRTLMNRIREHNHDLDTQIKTRTKELYFSRLSFIRTLAQVAEFRDSGTGDHINRIGRIAVLIGEKYGMPPAERETLYHASLLHDVGKIGIPDSVLLKPGPLTDNEWTIMRQHTRIGATLLSGNEYEVFKDAREVALHHHEKWDGTGYPDRLAGERIPLMGRICAVADVFDALTSERPYKKAWNADRAIDTIRTDSGTAFDPEVVASFLAVADKIVKIQDDAVEPDELPPELA
jgi:putative two-component system response regulator